MSTTTDQEPRVYEHEGLLWKPRPGCSSTFDDLVQARTRLMEILREVRWNPWREDELASEKEHADQVFQEWTRAEPDFQPMINRQVGAMMGTMKRKQRAQHRADQARWEREKERYEPAREQARFALLERESIRAGQERELAAYRSGERFPAMAPDRRTKEIAELETKLSTTTAEIARFSDVVSDREDVVDQDGMLPRDRRPGNLVMYSVRRHSKVEELQKSTAALREQIKGTKDQAAKSELGIHLHSEDRHLQALLSVPILTAEDMCADCYTPQFQHTPGGDLYESRSCPRWPLYAAHMERLWEMLRSAHERNQPADPEPPKPQPLATLPGNLSIAEVIANLTALQRDHPDAVVKRGRANRWELWPKEQ